MNRRYLVTLLIILSSPILSIRTEAAPETVPELFAGELEDVGPQYLLLPITRRQAWEIWTDLEITGTSNVTLVEENPEWSTITTVQAGVAWHSRVKPLWSGQFSWEAGARAHAYRYGYLSGEKQVINFVEVDRNNFDLVGVHLRGAWWRENWVATAGLRTSTMRNRAASHTFYEELALEWLVMHTWTLTPERTLAAGLEGAARITNTDSYGIFPRRWNDRVEMGFFALLDQAIGGSWHFQPSMRAQGGSYTYSGRSRTDWHFSGQLAVTHPLGRKAELRISAGYDQRESTEADISDYQKWDLTLALGASWRF